MVLVALFIIVEKPVQQKFSGCYAELADTLEFSSCASIAAGRSEMFEVRSTEFRTQS